MKQYTRQSFWWHSCYGYWETLVSEIRLNHTSSMAVVTVLIRFSIGVIMAFFVLSIGCWIFCWQGACVQNKLTHSICEEQMLNRRGQPETSAAEWLALQKLYSTFIMLLSTLIFIKQLLTYRINNRFVQKKKVGWKPPEIGHAKKK